MTARKKVILHRHGADNRPSVLRRRITRRKDRLPQVIALTLRDRVWLALAAKMAPMTVRELAGATGANPGAVRAVLAHEWFVERGVAWDLAVRG